MRFQAYLLKTLKENLRDWKILIFALAFAPCFIFIMYAAFGNRNQSYTIILINHETPDDKVHSKALLNLLTDSTYADGGRKYRITLSTNTEESIARLKNRSADALAVIPADFTSTLKTAAVTTSYTPVKLKLYGDPRNSRYAIASILLLTDCDNFIKDVTHVKTPVELDEELIGKGKALTEFDFQVPGIIVFALLNVMFTAGASFIKEIEKGTVTRLYMSKMKTVEMIGAISTIQAVLCVLSMILTLLAALLCGFEFNGSWAAFIVIGMISSTGILGIALVTVSFIRTVYDLMTVGVIPYFVVMFFAGMFFPLPPLVIATVGTNTVRLNDFLPLSLSVTAFNKVLNYGSGLFELGFETAGVTVVSLLYFIIGLYLFHRRHMRLGA